MTVRKLVFALAGLIVIISCAAMSLAVARALGLL